MDNKDIAFCIFQHLELIEIINYSTINTLIKSICDMQYERLLIYDYGKIFVKFFNDKTFKQSYVKCYNLNAIRKLYMFNSSLINFFNLTNIDVIDHQIKIIPKSIKQLNNLQQLRLSYNQIEEIPTSIGQLINLQQLWLSSNKIPESIGQLINLQQLLLSYNQIKKIPESIGVETSATTLVRLFTCL
jgi:hypothetical protein